MFFQSKRSANFSPGHLAMFCLVLALLGPPTTITVTSQTCTPPTVTVLEIFPSTVENCYKDAGARMRIDAAADKLPVSWKFIAGWESLDLKEPQYVYSSGTEIEVHGYCPGGHFIEVCDADGCCDTVAIELDEGTYCIGFNLECVGNICHNEFKARVSGWGGAGGLTITWELDGEVVHSSGFEDVILTDRGMYTITATDDNGCSHSWNYLIDYVDVASAEVKDVSCAGLNDGSIDFTLQGGRAGLFSDTDYHTKVETADSGKTVYGFATGVRRYDNLPAGNYRIVITDGVPYQIDNWGDTIHNRCKNWYFFTIEEPDPLAVEAAVTAIIPCGATSGGAIEIEISGGTPEYQIVWKDRFGTQLFPADPLNPVDLEPGDYTATVTDQHGCSELLTIEIEDPLKDPPIEITFDIVDYASSQYGVDCWATIKALVSGGVEPYTYEWSHYSSTSYDWFTNVPRPSGPITVTVIDARGCTMQATIDLGACPIEDDGDHDRPDVFILPNPSGGAFTLRLDLSAPKDVSYNISDLYGFEILNVDLGSLGAGVFDFPVDIASEPNGQYYLQVLSTGNTPNTVLVMKE